MIMTNYWDKIGRKLNKKERFNYVNERIDVIMEELGLEGPTGTIPPVDEEEEETPEVATGDLKVTVKNEDAETVEGCTITLTDETEHEYTGTTVSAGGCTIREIPVGEYSVFLAKEGYKDSQAEDITIQAGENTIEFVLKNEDKL